MSDAKQRILGASIGGGRLRRRRFQPAYPAGYLQQKQQHLVSLKDVDNRLLREGTRFGEQTRTREHKEVVYDRPLSVTMSKIQMGDHETYTFDREALPQAGVNNIAAGAVQFPLVTVPISQGIRGAVKRFGWFAQGAGAAQNLTFGLYVGDSLMLPGGKFIGDNPQTVLNYSPSGGSTNFEQLSECHIPVDPDNQIRILVTNNDAANAYSAGARLFGIHYEDEVRESGVRSYYNQELDKITS